MSPVESARVWSIHKKWRSSWIIFTPGTLRSRPIGRNSPLKCPQSRDWMFFEVQERLVQFINSEVRILKMCVNKSQRGNAPATLIPLWRSPDVPSKRRSDWCWLMLVFTVQMLVTYQAKTEEQRDCKTPGGWERGKISLQMIQISRLHLQISYLIRPTAHNRIFSIYNHVNQREATNPHTGQAATTKSLRNDFENCLLIDNLFYKINPSSWCWVTRQWT